MPVSHPVLIVDDEPNATTLVARILGRVGYRCDVAQDAEEALAKTAAQDYAAALLDIGLPGMDGITLLERLREARPELATLVVTGDSSAQTAVEAVKRGADDYLVKPFAAEQLIASLEHALRLRRLETENRAYREHLEQLVEARTAELGDRDRRMRQLLMGSVAALCTALEAKDQYTEGHSRRVAEYAVLIGAALRLPDEDVERLRLAGLLHDIGKIGVRDEVLTRPGPLSHVEYLHVISHATLGAEILGAIPELAELARWIRHHHERYDGSGAPDGLAGTNIPLPSRIIAVADAYDAMTSSRPYRPGMTEEEARAELQRQQGQQWDPICVQRFLTALAHRRRPKGGSAARDHATETVAAAPRACSG
jgi:putative nucleotidyltransferase with HDIG domain